jgi:hypothetical protein
LQQSGSLLGFFGVGGSEHLGRHIDRIIRHGME